MDGDLTQYFEYNNGVKQGYKLVPTLFRIYASVSIRRFQGNQTYLQLKVRFRYDGDLLDLNGLN